MDGALRQRVERALDDVIARLIVEEVLRRIAALPASWLVLFNGAAAGFERALASLDAAKNAGNIRMNAVWTAGASRVLSAERIAAVLGGRPLDANDPAVPGLFEEADLILLPTLALSTAAKLAACIRDCDASRLLSDAIIGGKRLIAAVDGALPFGEKTPAAYRKKAEGHLAQIAQYGVNLTTAGQIGRAALENGRKPPALRRLNDRIITQTALGGIPPQTRLSIRPDAVVTPLAQDAARARGITLRREQEVCP